MGAALYDDSPVFVKTWLGGTKLYESGKNRLHEIKFRIVETRGAAYPSKPTFHDSYLQIESMTEELTYSGDETFHDWTAMISGFNRNAPNIRTAIPFMNWSMLIAHGLLEWTPIFKTLRVLGLAGALPFCNVEAGKIIRVCPGIITLQSTVLPYVAAEPKP